MMIRRTLSQATSLAPLCVASSSFSPSPSPLLVRGGCEMGKGRNTSSLYNNQQQQQQQQQGGWYSASWGVVVGAGVVGGVGLSLLCKEEGRGVVLAEEKRRKQHPYFPELVNLGGEGGKATERYQHLLGFGKRIVLRVLTAYEVGFYIDTQGKNDLSGKTAESENEAVGLLLDGNHSRMLRLVTYRKVPKGHLTGGFAKSLLPAMMEKRTKYGCSEEEVNELFKQFSDFIPKIIPVSTPLHFVCHPPNVLEFYVDNEFLGKIESPLLCDTVFEIYLGDKCITPELRKEAANGIQYL